MVILHAGYFGGRLVLWGETPADPDVQVRLRPGRKPKIPRPLPSPYNPGAALLTETLRDVGAGLRLDPEAAERTVVWLPTTGRRPAACDALVAERPDPGAAVKLQPWEVTGFSLAPRQWVDLLCLCVGKQTLAPGVVVGYDLRYWSTAVRFAGALVARQQFLPGLAQQDGSYWARWEPLFEGADAERLAKLAQAMPPACRALTAAGLPAPATPAPEVLAEVVRYLLDPLVRQAAADAGPQPVPARRKKPAGFDSLHDQWMHALRWGDGGMTGDPGALEEFAQQVRAWRQPLAATTASPFRLCFRLDEPAAQEAGRDAVGDIAPTGEPWRVAYLLQAADDPSLLVPASNAWSDKQQMAFRLGGPPFNAREYLLLALGQASGLCTRIEQSLRGPAPAGYTTDEVGAYEFLSTTAQALEQAGAQGHQAPSDRSGPRLRAGNEGSGDTVSGEPRQVQLGNCAGRSEAVAAGAGGSGEAQGPAGARPGPVGPHEPRRDPGRPRLLEAAQG
jgi:hypothetical protein